MLLVPQQDEDASEEIPLSNEPANDSTQTEEIPLEEASLPSDPLTRLATLAPAVSNKDKDSDAPSSPKFASRPPSGADSYDPLSDNGLENVDLGLLNEEIDRLDGGTSTAATVKDRGNVFSPAAASSSSAAAEAGVSTRPVARIRVSVADPVKLVSVRIYST